MTFNSNIPGYFPGNKRIQPNQLCYVRNMPKQWECPPMRNGVIVRTKQFVGFGRLIIPGHSQIFGDLWELHMIAGKEALPGTEGLATRAKWLVPISDPSGELDIFTKDQETAEKEKEAERMLANFRAAFPGVADAAGKLRVLVIRPAK